MEAGGAHVCQSCHWPSGVGFFLGQDQADLSSIEQISWPRINRDVAPHSEVSRFASEKVRHVQDVGTPRGRRRELELLEDRQLLSTVRRTIIILPHIHAHHHAIVESSARKRPDAERHLLQRGEHDRRGQLPISGWQGIRNGDTAGQYLITGTSGSTGMLYIGSISGQGTSNTVNVPRRVEHQRLRAEQSGRRPGPARRQLPDRELLGRQRFLLPGHRRQWDCDRDLSHPRLSGGDIQLHP